jgi:adenylylsulfate kinase
VALISPVRSARNQVRQSMAEGEMLEVWCQCPPEVCATRDPKGHYRQAQRGLIRNFTGVSAPYEAPLQADLVLDTAHQRLTDSVQQLLARLRL